MDIYDLLYNAVVNVDSDLFLKKFQPHSLKKLPMLLAGWQLGIRYKIHNNNCYCCCNQITQSQQHSIYKVNWNNIKNTTSQTLQITSKNLLSNCRHSKATKAYSSKTNNLSNICIYLQYNYRHHNLTLLCTLCIEKFQSVYKHNKYPTTFHCLANDMFQLYHSQISQLCIAGHCWRQEKPVRLMLLWKPKHGQSHQQAANLSWIVTLLQQDAKLT